MPAWSRPFSADFLIQDVHACVINIAMHDLANCGDQTVPKSLQIAEPQPLIAICLANMTRHIWRRLAER